MKIQKLILLEKNYPIIYEIHQGENLIFTTDNRRFAKDLVKSYNSYVSRIKKRNK